MNNQQIDEEAIFHAARHVIETRRVDELLRVHQEEQSFLEPRQIVDPNWNMSHVTEKPGTQIGPYKLREQIGEGGFGVVSWPSRKNRSGGVWR